MTVRGYQKPLYILPFDHRGSFETGMFGWKGALDAEQTAQIAAAKQVIYDGFQQAVAGGVPKDKAGILVDEQFGLAILRDAAAKGFTFACPAEKSGQEEFDFEYGEQFAEHIEVHSPDFLQSARPLQSRGGCRAEPRSGSAPQAVVRLPRERESQPVHV